MFDTIVVAIDGSGHARRAVTTAGALAGRLCATLHLLHVAVPGAIPKELREFAEVENIEGSNLAEQLGERVLQDSEASAAQAGASRVVKVLRHGDPVAVVPAYAKEVNASMLVVGRRGLGAMRELLLGSVSHKLVQSATCTCLIVP